MKSISEHTIQTQCVAWFAHQYPKLRGLLFAIPNGGQRGKAQAGKLRAEGVQRGVADLFLSVPALPNSRVSSSMWAHGLYIEMKNATGRQTADQAAFQKQVESKGYMYRICRTLEEFQVQINSHIEKSPAA